MVIEAVFENRELKAAVTKESEVVLGPNAVFASNTSTLPISGLAKASARPQNFIGIHFFSPVDKMQLVEIILGAKTSDYAIAMAIDLVKKIKKTPIVVNDGRGFYTTRVVLTYIFEGLECLANGVSPALIENAGKMAGMPVGPLALADELSLELCYKINKQTELDTGKIRNDAAISVINKFFEELDRPGKKAKKGFYDYPQGGKKVLWTGIADVYPQLSKQPEVEEIKKRLLFIQSLEAVKCIESKIVNKPADADIGSILGWGFAPYSGGVISYIDTIGLKKFVADCNLLAKKYGKRFKPTSKMKEMAVKGKYYYQDYIVLALLPSYLERSGSSLIYMAEDLIKRSKNSLEGFYLNNYNELIIRLNELEQQGQKTLLLGVSYAFLDLIEKEKFQLNHTIVMETGGMKGKRSEIST